MITNNVIDLMDRAPDERARHVRNAEAVLLSDFPHKAEDLRTASLVLISWGDEWQADLGRDVLRSLPYEEQISQHSLQVGLAIIAFAFFVITAIAALLLLLDVAAHEPRAGRAIPAGSPFGQLPGVVFVSAPGAF